MLLSLLPWAVAIVIIIFARHEIRYSLTFCCVCNRTIVKKWHSFSFLPYVTLCIARKKAPYNFLLSQDVCPSVCLSVTRRYFVENWLNIRSSCSQTVRSGFATANGYDATHADKNRTKEFSQKWQIGFENQISMPKYVTQSIPRWQSAQRLCRSKKIDLKWRNWDMTFNF